MCGLAAARVGPYIGGAMKRLSLLAAALLFSGTAVQADYVMSNPQRLSRCVKSGGTSSWTGGAQYWTTKGCQKGHFEILQLFGDVTEHFSVSDLRRLGECRLKAVRRFNAENPERAIKPGEPYLTEMVKDCD